MQEGNHVGQILSRQRGFETLGHQGAAGALQGFNVGSEDGAQTRVGEFEGDAGGVFRGNEPKQLLAAAQSAGVGMIAGLDVKIWIQDVDENLFGRMRGNRAQVGADGQSFVADLVAGGAGALIHGVAASDIPSQPQGIAMCLHDLGATRRSGVVQEPGCGLHDPFVRMIEQPRSPGRIQLRCAQRSLFDGVKQCS